MQYRNQKVIRTIVPITLRQTSYCACAFPWDDGWFLMGSRRLKEWWPQDWLLLKCNRFTFSFFEG